jgi:hypothetical protein
MKRRVARITEAPSGAVSVRDDSEIGLRVRIFNDHTTSTVSPASSIRLRMTILIHRLKTKNTGIKRLRIFISEDGRTLPMSYHPP